MRKLRGFLYGGFYLNRKCGGKVLFFCLMILTVFPAMSADRALNWKILWTGSWANSFNTGDSGFSAGSIFGGGTLTTRGEVILELPALDLGFRFQAADMRKLPGADAGAFNPGAAIYFGGKGPAGKFFGNSRLLYGVLDEYGLAARIKNMWAKSAPYAEFRKPSVRDLKLQPSASNVPETYLYLGLPKLGLFTGYVSAQFDKKFFPAFGAGLELRTPRKAHFLFEGFFTWRTLEPHSPQSWFSVDPPLPERRFNLLGLACAMDYGILGLAMDFAFSRTFAWGSDFYLNAGLRIGGKPWKFSLAADIVGSRYVGRDGAIPGGGLRIAGRLERSWIRSGLFRAETVIRSHGLAQPFDRGSLYFYFRPSAPRGRSVPVFRVTKASLSFARNADSPQKTDNSLDAVFGFNIRAFRFVLTGNLDSRSVLEKNNIFLPPFFGHFQSFRIALESGWSFKNVSLTAKTGYAIRKGKTNIWDFSLNTSINLWKMGRIGFKIASSEFPHKWNYTISYRLGRFTF